MVRSASRADNCHRRRTQALEVRSFQPDPLTGHQLGGQAQPADGDACQPFDAVAGGGDHALDQMVFPFGDGEAQQALGEHFARCRRDWRA